jgi:hypothetical protein
VHGHIPKNLPPPEQKTRILSSLKVVIPDTTL